MKKILVFALLIGMISYQALAVAEEMQGMGGDMPQEQGMSRGQEDGQGQMRRPKMNPMMMGMMGGKESLVATSDGGIVVLAGPKLLKYDKDLNLIKEVEIKKGKKPGSGQMQEPPPQEPADDLQEEPAPPAN